MRSIGYRLLLVAAVVVLPLAVDAAPAKGTNALAPQVVTSTFVIPKTSQDGCDPFYPKATSLYQIQTTNAAVVEAPKFELLKFTGNVGSSLATINGKTLAPGDTEDVKTPAGAVSVHLIQINGDESVVVEVNGERHELKRATGAGGLTHQ